MALGVRRLTLHPFLSGHHPIAMAHRGFTRDAPENTTAAFQAAIDLGYRYLETDVRATCDGQAVLFHDATLQRLTGSPEAIASLNWRRLSEVSLAGGHPIPRLVEVLRRWPQVCLNLDVKSDDAVAPVTAAIRDTVAAQRVCVTAFDDRRRRAALRELREDPPATSAGVIDSARALLPGGLPRLWPKVDCLQLPAGVVSRRLVRRAHERRCQVHVWTVNDESQMCRLLDLGVDGIVTDRPDTLRRILTERGSWQA